MIFVAGRNIESVEQLSLDFQQVLSIIKNGYDWFNWALNEPSLSVYYAISEQDLLRKIQTGLHETELLRNKYFTLSILKAIAFQDEDREALISIFNKKNVSKTTVQAIMNKYDLVGQNELDSLPQLLTTFQLNGVPLFDNMTLREAIEVYSFISKQVSPQQVSDENSESASGASTSSSGGSKTGRSSKSKKPTAQSNLSQESVDFAKGKASTPSEFVNYARFYQACANYQIPDNTDKSLRPDIIDTLYDQLAEVCFKLIYVPNIGQTDPESLRPEELKNAILGSKYLGYRQRGAAMENLARNIQIKDVSASALQQNIDKYLMMVRETITNGYLQTQPVTQTGWPLLYLCQDEELKVVVQVTPGGDIFLSPDSVNLKEDELIAFD